MDIQNNLILLKEFLSILEKCQVKYWLDAGTLLGIIRKGELMNYDSDMDIGVYYEEFQPKLELVRLEANKQGIFPNPKHIETLKSGFLEKFLYKDINKIDVFMFKKYKNLYYHRAWGGVFYWKEDLLNTLDTYVVNEFSFSVPHNPQIFLQKLYGINWKIPCVNMSKPRGYTNYVRCNKINMERTLDEIIKKGLVN